jgi:hypothetical protein
MTFPLSRLELNLVHWKNPHITNRSINLPPEIIASPSAYLIISCPENPDEQTLEPNFNFSLTPPSPPSSDTYGVISFPPETQNIRYYHCSSSPCQLVLLRQDGLEQKRSFLTLQAQQSTDLVQIQTDYFSVRAKEKINFAGLEFGREVFFPLTDRPSLKEKRKEYTLELILLPSSDQPYQPHHQ